MTVALLEFYTSKPSLTSMTILRYLYKTTAIMDAKQANELTELVALLT